MKKKRIKNGFTLAELSVVIALIAILSVSIVSFTMTIHAHIDNFYSVIDVVDDMTFCRKVVVAWFSHFDTSDYEINVLGQELTAKHLTEGSEYRLYLQQDYDADGELTESTVIAQYDDGQTATYVTNGVIFLSFAKSADGQLVRCDMSCKSVGAGSDSSTRYDVYNFVVGKKVVAQ